jgi:hypothetical protein
MTQKRKRLDPTWAPFVISGRGVAEGHINPSNARFAFQRRSKLCPGLSMLWQWKREPERYDLIGIDLSTARFD